MEKVHGRMLESVGDIIDFNNMKLPDEDYTGAGQDCQESDGSVFRDCANLSDGPQEEQQGAAPYERGSDILKWEHFVKDNAVGSSLSSKFIKDEQEASVIMDAPCPAFDALDSCSQVVQKQPHFGFGEPECARFAPVGPRPAQEASPNFLVHMSPAEQMGHGQPRVEARGSTLAGKGAAYHLDASAPSPVHLAVYKSEVGRWQVPAAAPGEAQFWCQPAGVTEDPFGYNGMHSQAVVARNQTTFNAFAGLPPQRACVICGDEASGCHYGVLTCGSCKVFFKRAVEGHHSYLCAGRNDCIVDKIRRKNCPACRLRKCYQAGMMLGGRKLKRFGALKALGLSASAVFPPHLSVSADGQALGTAAGVPGVQEMTFSQQIINILENIEPETVFSGYDGAQADVPHLLLTSLNRLCEKQLRWIVKWSKSLPGFRNLHITDQMTLIQYSWMNLMVFSLGWRSFKNVTREYMYFAPDLVLSLEQMRRSPIYDLCLAIQFIPQEFANLQVTREEFLCMKAIILLNTVPLEGLKSQGAFEEMRQNYIRELTKAIHVKEKGVLASSQRFYHLTKLMDAMHEIVKKVNLFCLSTFIQADAMKVEFPEMMTEVIASQLPKVLAGMVRPLLFHPK
ncbi:progesterone receptor-like [Corythoichthys intestinalis]|uniref:progesterone receptor-like n=1 Tax=Corythoichthys intestinalis TaxID=161448 RepID=UPI0025A4E28B|nr:progesterone receptor-like [Corythoichthys intestinalis]XP_057695537.1 progesterone receptor-like [Corythoichthys intestinalis]XP_061797568.1 progesterone receptor-like [Nerophis lumbriciformis]